MFTGIVGGTATIVDLKLDKGILSIAVSADENLREDLNTGASIAVNGVCLTVTNIATDYVVFDVIEESIRRTNLGRLIEGSVVNIERSLRQNDELGGHIVSGHVDSTAKVTELTRSEENLTVWMSVPEQWLKYIFSKGFIALNGVSLTVGVVNREKGNFCVYLIPETLRRTTFGAVQPGDEINIEVERQTQVIVDTIENCTGKLEKLLAGENKLSLLAEIKELIHSEVVTALQNR